MYIEDEIGIDGSFVFHQKQEYPNNNTKKDKIQSWSFKNKNRNENDKNTSNTIRISDSNSIKFTESTSNSCLFYN